MCMQNRMLWKIYVNANACARTYSHIHYCIRTMRWYNRVINTNRMLPFALSQVTHQCRTQNTHTHNETDVIMVRRRHRMHVSTTTVSIDAIKFHFSRLNALCAESIKWKWEKASERKQIKSKGENFYAILFIFISIAILNYFPGFQTFHNAHTAHHQLWSRRHSIAPSRHPLLCESRIQIDVNVYYTYSP